MTIDYGIFCRPRESQSARQWFLRCQVTLQSILVQKLTKQNKELSLQIKEYKDRLKQYSVPQPKTTADIMSRIWDNKEDEYWDTIWTARNSFIKYKFPEKPKIHPELF